MAKPVRYYITKSGEESTVRSVRVALGTQDPDATGESATAPTVQPANSVRHVPVQASAVTRRVKDAILRRPTELDQ